MSAEQLGSITEADAWAEGVLPASNSVTQRERKGCDLYQALWERVHGAESWGPNLWGGGWLSGRVAQ
ncbi:hypothetical protein GCM10008957_31160 [Deinococcus ruber]|uniref:Uncharacterized protein n=1 Tax=Deinococcus ruber TaxID=1848197 RepID=A0A918CC71_9DEIO|nr:hypothetical protein GCM10008957_31160 [Deinococcus ruber]